MKRQMLIVIVSATLAASAVAQPPARENFGAGGPAQNGAVGQPPVGSGGSPPNAMFQVIDGDGDGAITKRELRKAVVALKKLDTNKDGTITFAEAMTPQTGPSVSGEQNSFGGRTGFGNGPDGFSGTGGDPRPAGPNLMQYDRNGDGQLSADEVPTQLRGMLQGADQNNSGTLDARELQMIHQRMNERVRGGRSLPPGVSIGPQGVTREPQAP